MGYVQTWLAVKSEHADALKNRLGATHVQPIQNTDIDDESFEGFAQNTGFSLGNGWYLIVSLRPFSWDPEKRGWMGSLSDGIEVYLGFVEEHCMYSELSVWVNGSQQWRVKHDGSHRVDDLEVEGAPPAVLNEIIIKHRASQATQTKNEKHKADYIFEIPCDLGKGIFGYKHDEGFDCPVIMAEQLEIPNSRPSFWKRLLGISK
jgi:hypothetical protein